MNNITKNLLFTYGTLLDKDIQTQVLSKIIEWTSNILNNDKIAEITIDGDKYPNIYPSINNKVIGMVIRVTDEELSIIDRHETNNYKRVKIILMSGDYAWVYKGNQNNKRYS